MNKSQELFVSNTLILLILFEDDFQYIYLADGAGNVSYAGDGSSGVYIWGPQWEQGVLSNYSVRPSNSDFKAFQNRKVDYLRS